MLIPTPLSAQHPALASRSARIMAIYLISTEAPCSSRTFLIFSASSLLTASFTVFGRAFDQVLGFLQPKTGDGADFLDHVDLLVAGLGQDHRELGLLLDRCGGSAAAGWGCGYGDRSGGGNAPLFFQQLGKLGGLQTVRADSSSTSFVRSAIFRISLS